MILVTGATGNVGSQVVRQLGDRGAKLRVFVRDPDRAAQILGDVDTVTGDFAEADSLRAALDGVQRLFLACANDPRQVEYETRVIDAAVDAGVQRIVKLSTAGAQLDSPLSFARWQGQIEQHLRSVPVPAVLLHPCFSMANLLGLADPVRYQGVLPAPVGDAKIAMIDPSDVAAVAVLALTEDGHDGRTHSLTGPEPVTFSQVAEALSAAVGRAVTFADVPEAATGDSMRANGLPDWLVDGLLTVFRLIREGIAEQTTDTVEKLTGRKPRTVSQFAHDHAPQFQAG
jgi:uncharacterized protein YbjT (DUF2867 family)